MHSIEQLLIEDAKELNRALNKCFEKNASGENTETILENRLNDLYGELKDNIRASKLDNLKKFKDILEKDEEINQLVFFKFVYELYNDVDFVSCVNGKRRVKHTEAVEEIKKNLKIIVSELAQKSYSSRTTQKTADEAEMTKEELFNLTNYISLVHKLQQLYMKDTRFFVGSDLEVIDKIARRYAKTSKFEEYFEKAKRHFSVYRTDPYFKKSFSILSVGQLLTAILLSSVFKENFFKLTASLAIGNGATFSMMYLIPNNAAINDPIVRVLMFEKNLVYEKYAKLLRDDEASIKELLKIESGKTDKFRLCSEHQMNRLIENSKVFKDFQIELEPIQQKIQNRLKYIKGAQLSSVVHNEEYEKLEFLLKVFKNFSGEDQRSLFQMVSVSKDFSDELHQLLKASETFETSMRSIRTFDDLYNFIQTRITQKAFSNALSSADFSTLSHSRACASLI